MEQELNAKLRELLRKLAILRVAPLSGMNYERSSIQYRRRRE